MAVDRLVPTSSTPGTITGDSYMNSVSEEIVALWNRAHIKLGTVAGTANAITAVATPALTGSLVDGMLFTIVPTADCAGGGVTIKIGSLTAVPAVDRDGNTLAASELKAGRRTLLEFDSTSGSLHVIGQSGADVATTADLANYVPIDANLGIGCFILALGSAATVAAGTSAIAGSTLFYSSAAGDASGVPPGTYRQCGYRFNNTGDHRVTLFQRIA